MRKYVSQIETSHLCKNHTGREGAFQCGICGLFFCTSCVEQRIVPSKKEAAFVSHCIECKMNKYVKKNFYCYSINLVFPIISIIIWLLSYFNIRAAVSIIHGKPKWARHIRKLGKFTATSSKFTGFAYLSKVFGSQDIPE